GFWRLCWMSRVALGRWFGLGDGLPSVRARSRTSAPPRVVPLGLLLLEERNAVGSLYGAGADAIAPTAVYAEPPALEASAPASVAAPQAPRAEGPAPALPATLLGSSVIVGADMPPADVPPADAPSPSSLPVPLPAQPFDDDWDTPLPPADQVFADPLN